MISLFLPDHKAQTRMPHWRIPCSRMIGYFLILIGFIVFLGGCNSSFSRDRVELDTEVTLRSLRCSPPIVPMLSADTQEVTLSSSPSAHILSLFFKCGKSTREGVEYTVTVNTLLTQDPEKVEQVSFPLRLYVTVVDNNMTIQQRILVEDNIRLTSAVSWDTRSIDVLLPYPQDDIMLKKSQPSALSGPLPQGKAQTTSIELQEFKENPQAYIVYVGFVPSDHDLKANQENYTANTHTFAQLWQERNLGISITSLPPAISLKK